MASYEYRILRAACQLDPAADHLEKLQNLLVRPVDSDRLIELAVKEGLTGLLYKNLLNTGSLGGLGPGRAQRLESFYHITVRNNLRLLHDLAEILQELNQKNIVVVLLQGIALLHLVYQDAGLRPLTDIDLWVLPGNRHALAQTLSGLAYQADMAYPNTFRKGSTIIDVNTHILWADRIRARSLVLHKSQENIHRNCRSINCEGGQALCLDPYDQVLYLILHALKHNVSRLIWLADIKNLIAPWQRSDWETLMKRARDLGLQKAVACIFFLFANLFDYYPPLESGAARQSMRLNVLEKMILKNREKGNPLPEWSPLLLFSAGQGLPRRLAFAFESLFPRREILRQVFVDYPDLKDWQLYWKRALQLLGAIK
ncbi:MAG: nucleotidyltransferase family protein [Deltaproteobacteria bacterium]|jgi:hypothetical protein|nr:nucleotidyltransferase family protein [Deltaproteobacteria bacterium]